MAKKKSSGENTAKVKVIEAKMNSKDRKVTEQIISAVALLALGVFFCLGLGTDVVSIIVGSALCLLGLINLVLIAVRLDSFISVSGLFNAFLIALGIIFITQNLISQVAGWIPYILMVVGVVIIAESFLAKFARFDINTAVFVIELIVGIALFVLGLLLLLVEDFRSAANIIFGVSLILSAVYSLIDLIANK